MTYEDDGKIEIIYTAVLNERKGHDWLPMIWVNGQRRGSTYADKGVDKDAAFELARQAAQAEAEHYTGDWDITIRRKD